MTTTESTTGRTVSRARIMAEAILFCVVIPIALAALGIVANGMAH